MLTAPLLPVPVATNFDARARWCRYRKLHTCTLSWKSRYCGAATARDIDDAAVAVAPHERNRRLAQSPRAEQVGVERSLHARDVDIRSAVAEIEERAGVVHQHIEFLR